MSAALGGNHLVCFEQGQNGARILQAELLRLKVNRSERALIFRDIRVV